jgi:hypothetical protein
MLPSQRCSYSADSPEKYTQPSVVDEFRRPRDRDLRPKRASRIVLEPMLELCYCHESDSAATNYTQLREDRCEEERPGDS